MSTIFEERIETVKNENAWKEDSYYLAISEKVMPNVSAKRDSWILQQVKNGRGKSPDYSKSYVGYNQRANIELGCQVILNGYDVSHLIKEYDYIIVESVRSLLEEE